ncbi:hypothetical protein OS493_040163, partial [Desmophyllum pertusum]
RNCPLSRTSKYESHGEVKSSWRLHLEAAFLVDLMPTLNASRGTQAFSVQKTQCHCPVHPLSDGCERGVDVVKNTDKERERGGDDSTGSSGSELCRVLLGVYDNAPSRKSSEILDEEQALVSAVLSSLLALSHSAKNCSFTR